MPEQYFYFSYTEVEVCFVHVALTFGMMQVTRQGYVVTADKKGSTRPLRLKSAL
jgi:hypothetical protein